LRQAPDLATDFASKFILGGGGNPRLHVGQPNKHQANQNLNEYLKSPYSNETPRCRVELQRGADNPGGGLE
jgi:hypothetical protein